ncbi:MAG: carboxyl transferase domain-containing protein, partial [Chitinispirillia bacterium]
MNEATEWNGPINKNNELFVEAENFLKDFSLFPESGELYKGKNIKGLLPDKEIEHTVALLNKTGVNDYIEKAILPAENKSRNGGKAILKKMGNKPIREENFGPFYSCEIELDFGNTYRRIGFIVQDRASNNGVWMPRHHYKAVNKLREFAQYSIPIVTFIDTPGADANEEANSQNQAHSISQLIAEMANIDVPTIGIIIGNGYSGGAIPLATANLIFSVRDGVFNTIQPRGLSAIARKYNLSWQECAKYVGVSAYELYKKGYIDGIIDFIPGEKGDTLENLKNTIVTGISSVEEYTRKFVLNNESLFDHYQESVRRFINPSKTLRSIQDVSDLSLAKTPTEHPNIFGLTYRYLRYLTLRKRIFSISIQNYGRLAKQEIPKGDLLKRKRNEQLKSFFLWLQDPDKIIYDDNLNKSWKNYISKMEDLKNKKNWLSRHIFGDSQANFNQARAELILNIGFFLYTRWKKNAHDNFISLIKYVRNYKESVFLFKVSDFFDSPKLVKKLKLRSNPIEKYLYDSFSYELKKLISESENSVLKSNIIEGQLAFELNQIIQKKRLYNEKKFITPDISPQFLNKIKSIGKTEISAALNRELIEILFPSHIKRRVVGAKIKKRNLTILDIILSKNFRNEFITECQNFIFFNLIYDNIVSNLILIAKEANKTKILAEGSVAKLLNDAIQKTAKEFISYNILVKESEENVIEDRLKDQFSIWLNNFIHHSDCGKKLKLIEEWKKIVFPRISETLFVIITFFFEKLLPEYYAAQNSKRKYTGKVNPVHIGKKKNFWHRLTLAYNDLLIQDILLKEKRTNPILPEKIIKKYFTDFTDINGQIMTSDPVNFPGFRISIEESISRGITPCGIITGIGKLNLKSLKAHAGVIISNTKFQAGAFDMASSEKVCKLLVKCAVKKLPVIGFISSSGMQTKEGAGALFSMPVVNDRFTRFIRENDLPILIFGFGDCTGGAQASFVTHPMVQTYYFSGT